MCFENSFDQLASFVANGIELLKLQLLARWSSDVILRYVRESPLCKITGDYLKSAKGSSLDEVLAQMQISVEAAVARIDELDSTTKQMLLQERSLREKTTAEKSEVSIGEPKYIENMKTGAVHRSVGPWQVSSPNRWATARGRKYDLSVRPQGRWIFV